jgi:hypothetical protein
MSESVGEHVGGLQLLSLVGVHVHVEREAGARMAEGAIDDVGTDAVLPTSLRGAAPLGEKRDASDVYEQTQDG